MKTPQPLVDLRMLLAKLAVEYGDCAQGQETDHRPDLESL